MLRTGWSLRQTPRLGDSYHCGVQGWHPGFLTPVVLLSGPAAPEVQLLAHIIFSVFQEEKLEEKEEKLISHIIQLPHFVARLFPHEQFVFI